MCPILFYLDKNNELECYSQFKDGRGQGWDVLEAGVLAGDLSQFPVADTLRVEVTALGVHQGHYQGQGQQQPETHVCRAHVLPYTELSHTQGVPGRGAGRAVHLH